MTDTARPSRNFLGLWAGQTLSLIGTEVAAIGVSFVAFLETGSIVWLAGLFLATRIPALVLSSRAGALVDRIATRTVLLGADTAAAIGTMLAFGLHLVGALELWHLIAVAAIGSLANAYQLPAYQAAVPALVEPAALPRAQGLLQLGPAAGLLVAPALAGIVTATAGIGGLLVIDIATFAIAFVATALTRFPDHNDATTAATRPRTGPRTGPETGGLRATWDHLSIGRRRGVRRLVLWGSAINFTITTVNLLLPALLLTLTSEGQTGLILTVGGVAMLASSIAVSGRGLPERRVSTVIAGTALVGTGIVLVGLRPELPLVILGVVLTLAGAPIIGAAAGAIHHSEVALDWQGRHAAFRRVVAESLTLPAILVITPLVEAVVDPAVAPGGWGVDTIGRLVGVGDGRGYGLAIALSGLAVLALAAAMSRDAVLRRVDTALPTADEAAIDPPAADTDAPNEDRQRTVDLTAY